MTTRSSLRTPALENALRQVEHTMAMWVQGPDHDVVGPMAREHLDTGGKRLRARLALAAAEVLKVPQAAAIAWAAACELSHNATLIHDDLQDGDTHRRGQPTTWVRHGAAQAINAGDLLLMLPFGMLQDAPLADDRRFRMCAALSRFMSTVIRGQAMECGLLAEGVTDRAIYEATIRGKTSALFELPVHGAAIAAGCTTADARALTAPFEALGMLFQMQDDVLDCFGDKGRDKLGSDLYEGKISALVVAHLEVRPHERAALLTLLQEPRATTSDDAVAAMIEKFRTDGALQCVLERIRAEAAAAQAKADAASNSGLRQVLDDLIALVLQPIAHLDAATH